MSQRWISRTGLVVLVLANDLSHAEEAADRVFQRVSPSVVTILALDEKGLEDVQGSGVLISAGRVVTNCHVVREASKFKVVAGSQTFVATWTEQDRSRDLCLLRVDGLKGKPVTLRKSMDVQVGETAYAIGNPLGFGLSISTGLVAQIAQVEGEQVFVSTAPQSPGSSGGGLFDTEGRLLGITTSTLVTGQNVNLVQPAEWIARLKERSIPRPPNIVIPRPEPQWGSEAVDLMKSEIWDALEKHARDWWAIQPTSSVAATYLAIALFRQSRLSEAEAVLRKAVELDVNSEFSWRVSAAVLRDQGRRKEAWQALERAEKLLPYASNRFSLKGGWLEEEQRYAEAANAYHQAIRQEPGSPDYWRRLANVEERLGHDEEAANAYRVALRLAPNDTVSAEALASVLARQGYTDAARKALGANTMGRASQANTWLAMGQGELRKKRYQAAEEAFRKATEAAPNLLEAWYSLGIVMARTHRPAEAVVLYNRALELKPSSKALEGEILVNRGNARFGLGQVALAKADAERAIEVVPDFPDAYRLLGIVEITARNYLGALIPYQKLVDMGAAQVDDWASLGESLEKTGNKKSALEALQRAEQLDSKHAATLQSLAGFHGRNGDNARALEYAERALTLDSASPQNWSNKGYILMKLGRLDDAIKALQTAVSLDPVFANGWINLGEAQLRKGIAGQAIKSLEKAVGLSP